MATTRYREEDKIEYEGDTIFEIRDQLTVLAAAEDDEYYRARGGETLRDIAFEKWGDARLYWIIAELNAIVDPFEPIEGDTELRIPTRKRVIEEVF